MAQWNDVTSYSRGDKERRPGSWEFIAGDIRIVVSRWIHGEPNGWYLSCDPFFEREEVGRGVVEEAQSVALRMVRNRLKRSLEAIGTKEA